MSRTILSRRHLGFLWLPLPDQQKINIIHYQCNLWFSFVYSPSIYYLLGSYQDCHKIISDKMTYLKYQRVVMREKCDHRKWLVY